MARIRTIKPEFWHDEELSSLSPEACLLAIGLLNMADDEGYFKANPKLIEAAIFPLRELSLSTHGLISELSNIKYITVYSGDDGKKYGLVNNFLKHQKINRPNISKIKGLCKFTEDSLSDHGGLTVGTGNREQGMEQGKEGEGNAGEVGPSSEIDMDKIKHVEPLYHHYFKLFEDIKPYNIVPIRSEVISLFKEAAQGVPEVQILEAAANYKMHLKHSEQPVEYRKSVKTFLSEKQYKIDWLMQHKINKRGDSPKELWDLWLARNLKHPTFEWST